MKKLPGIGENSRARAKTIETHAQNTPNQDSAVDFKGPYYGETDLSRVNNVYVNRFDTPSDVTCGGPIVLNKGESIFTPFPRRVNEGSTIRCDQEQDVPPARTMPVKLKVKG